MKQRHAITPEQFRERLRGRGMTLVQWSLDHGFPVTAVSRVLNGADKARYGRAHEIAVALGLKIPPADESTGSVVTRNTHERQAA